MLLLKLSMCAKSYQQRFEALNSLLKFRERVVFPKCETSEGLYAKARDFKLMCSIDCNNYLEGTRCFANEIKGVRSRYCIFVCSGWCKRITERRKLRCREPSRIRSRLKIAIPKNRKIRCLLKEYWGLFQGRKNTLRVLLPPGAFKAPFTRVWTNFCLYVQILARLHHAFTRDQQNWTNFWTAKCASLGPEKGRSTFWPARFHSVITRTVQLFAQIARLRPGI